MAAGRWDLVAFDDPDAGRNTERRRQARSPDHGAPREPECPNWPDHGLPQAGEIRLPSAVRGIPVDWPWPDTGVTPPTRIAAETAAPAARIASAIRVCILSPNQVHDSKNRAAQQISFNLLCQDTTPRLGGTGASVSKQRPIRMACGKRTDKEKKCLRPTGTTSGESEARQSTWSRRSSRPSPARSSPARACR